MEKDTSEKAESGTSFGSNREESGNEFAITIHNTEVVDGALKTGLTAQLNTGGKSTEWGGGVIVLHKDGKLTNHSHSV